MTDPNYTAMLIVLDRSGSMSDIRDDMVGGLEQMLATQAAEPGLLTVDIVTFDDEICRYKSHPRERGRGTMKHCLREAKWPAIADHRALPIHVGSQKPPTGDAGSD